MAMNELPGPRGVIQPHERTASQRSSTLNRGFPGGSMAAVNVATKTGAVTMKVAQISKPKAGFDIVEREIP